MITRKQAGVIYGAYKSGKVVCKPEFISHVYNLVERNELVYEDGSLAILGCSSAIDSWKEDNAFLAEIVEDIFNNGNFNEKIARWEKEVIELCGKKSVWFKYKKAR